MCVGLAGEVEGRERGRGCVVWATGTWGVGSTLWRSLAFLVFSCLFLVFSFSFLFLFFSFLFLFFSFSFLLKQKKSIRTVYEKYTKSISKKSRRKAGEKTKKRKAPLLLFPPCREVNPV